MLFIHWRELWKCRRVSKFVMIRSLKIVDRVVVLLVSRDKTLAFTLGKQNSSVWTYDGLLEKFSTFESTSFFFRFSCEERAHAHLYFWGQDIRCSDVLFRKQKSSVGSSGWSFDLPLHNASAIAMCLLERLWHTSDEFYHFKFVEKSRSALPSSRSATVETSTTPAIYSNPCIYNHARFGTIDLSSVGNLNGTAVFADVPTIYSDDYLWSYNPCVPFTERSCYRVAGCQSKLTISLSDGEKSWL